jgi:hypothetical protein
VVWRVGPQRSLPVLYGLSNNKDACVAAHMDFSSGSLQWDVSFLRAAHDWEVDVLVSFYTLLYSFRGSIFFFDK